MIDQTRRLYTVCRVLLWDQCCLCRLCAYIRGVTANTMSRLFDAQRQHPQAEPLPSQTNSTAARQERPQRSTLHAFWRIPKPAPAPTVDTSMINDFPANSAADSGLRCEDCEDALRRDDAMDLDEASLFQELACIVCKRCVCDRCAVLGNARVCLGCASGHER